MPEATPSVFSQAFLNCAITLAKINCEHMASVKAKQPPLSPRGRNPNNERSQQCTRIFSAHASNASFRNPSWAYAVRSGVCPFPIDVF